jgi:hypothetical protein
MRYLCPVFVLLLLAGSAAATEPETRAVDVAMHAEAGSARPITSLDERLRKWTLRQPTAPALSTNYPTWETKRGRVLAEVSREIQEVQGVDVVRLQSNDPWDAKFREDMSRLVVEKVHHGFSEGLGDILLEKTHLDRSIKKLRKVTTFTPGAKKNPGKPAPVKMSLGFASSLPSLEMRYKKGRHMLEFDIGVAGFAEIEYQPFETDATHVKFRFDPRDTRTDLTCRFSF